MKFVKEFIVVHGLYMQSVSKKKYLLKYLLYGIVCIPEYYTSLDV